MKVPVEEPIPLSSRKIRSLNGNPEKSAQAIHLLYVHDTDQGIRRIKEGKHFRYLEKENTIIRDKAILNRIDSLRIPPAWKNVWICPVENGHLQATGYDTKNRKQYIYHSHWHSLRNQTKFYRLVQFGHAIPAIRLRIQKDLALPGMPVEKVLALVLNLMEYTNMRVGNSTYEKLYGSFGLTTLKNKHVHIAGSVLKFSFKGKKGVYHDISVKNKRLAKIVKACRDIPGKELFQYYTPEGVKKSIDSGMVNTYIKEITGDDFTAKDFRTWSGTLLAFHALLEAGSFESETEARKKVVEVLNTVSQQLGNTRNVCKKYYVHPMLLSMYETGTLDKYFSQLQDVKENDPATRLSLEEEMMLKILES